jgi:hypothetical protein
MGGSGLKSVSGSITDQAIGFLMTEFAGGESEAGAASDDATAFGSSALFAGGDRFAGSDTEIAMESAFVFGEGFTDPVFVGASASGHNLEIVFSTLDELRRSKRTPPTKAPTMATATRIMVISIEV